MRLLAIETASEVCSVALSIDGEVHQQDQHAPRGHAEFLLPAVEQLLTDGGVELQHLDAILYGRGPGSFTSLRIGLGAVQGLAWGADVPVHGISSLAALAWEATQRFAEEGTGRVLAAMDARMNEVFLAGFLISADSAECLVEEQVVSPTETPSLNNGEWMGAGIGFERYPVLAERYPGMVMQADVWPSARALIALGTASVAAGETRAAETVQARYIRNDVARKAADR